MVVLAAGQSLRAGSLNKLLAPVAAGTMIEQTVGAVLASEPADIVVVTGHQQGVIRAALAAQEPIRYAHNPHFDQGLGSSLATGVAALGSDIDAALVCLGDMPLINAPLLKKIQTAFDPARDCSIVVPCYRRKRGNPVLWARRFFPELMSISGDVGGRRLIDENHDQVCELEVGDDAVLRDFDSPESLARLADEVSGS